MEGAPPRKSANRVWRSGAEVPMLSLSAPARYGVRGQRPSPRRARPATPLWLGAERPMATTRPPAATATHACRSRAFRLRREPKRRRRVLTPPLPPHSTSSRARTRSRCAQIAAAAIACWRDGTWQHRVRGIGVAGGGHPTCSSPSIRQLMPLPMPRRATFCPGRRGRASRARAAVTGRDAEPQLPSSAKVEKSRARSRPRAS